jgi:multidrug efflux pump subunit AcrA (membrane-fusion protein)
VFFANFDVGYFQLPGYSNFIDEWWLQVLPGYFPVQLAIDAGFTSVADLLLPSFWTIPHSVVVVGVMLGAYSKVTQVRPFMSEQRRRIPWWAAGLAILVVGTIVGVAGYIYWSAQPPTVVADGRMDANDARIVATTTGRISVLTVEEGTIVEQSQTIGWITDASDGSLVPLQVPMRGQVTTLNVRQDENVISGDVLAEMYQTDSMVAALEVDENSIDKVAIGQKVEVTSGSLNLKSTARVVSIALTPLPPDPSVSERSRKIRKHIVKCQLDQPDPRLLIGMVVKARIFTDSGLGEF